MRVLPLLIFSIAVLFSPVFATDYQKSAPNLCGFYQGTSVTCTGAITNFCSPTQYYPLKLCSSRLSSCVAATSSNSCAVCGKCLGLNDVCLKVACGTSNSYGCALTCDGVATGSSHCAAKSDEGGSCKCDGMCNAPFTCEASKCRLAPQNMTWVYPPAGNMNVTGNPNCRMNYTFDLTNASAVECGGVMLPLGGGFPPVTIPFAPDSNTSCSFDALTGWFNYTFYIEDSNGLINWTPTINFTCNMPTTIMEWIAPAANNSGVIGNSFDFRFNATPTWNNTDYNITDCGIYLTNSTDFPAVLAGDYNSTTYVCNVTGYTEPQEDVSIIAYASNAYAANDTEPWDFWFLYPACANLTTPNEVYRLRTNATSTGTCMNITASNVTVDCDGFFLTGSNNTNASGVHSSGIYSTAANTTTENCVITNFQYGIYYKAANGVIENCTANTTHSNGMGIYYALGSNLGSVNNSQAYSASSYGMFVATDNHTVANSSIASTAGVGLFLSSAENNNFTNITASSVMTHAVAINYDSNFNRVSQSTMTTGTGGIALEMLEANNNTIEYTTITSPASAATWIQDTIGNVFHNITTRSPSSGLILFTSNYTSVYDSWINSSNSIPVDMQGSSYSRMWNNTFVSGSGHHILLSVDVDSFNNTFYWNNFTATTGYYVRDSNGSNFYNATINDSNEGNVWANVIDGSVAISGTNNSIGYPNLLIGTGGAGFPYINTTSMSKFFCNFVGCGDYAPLTLLLRSNINITGLIDEHYNLTTILNQNITTTSHYTDLAATPYMLIYDFLGLLGLVFGIYLLTTNGLEMFAEPKRIAARKRKSRR